MQTLQELYAEIDRLQAIHDAKQNKYQLENGYGDDVGCLTREACQLAALLPRLQDYGLHYPSVKWAEISKRCG